MSAGAHGPGERERPVSEAVDEAMILWRLCTRLANRLWESHEAEFIERLVAEGRARRCEYHPWERRGTCVHCADDAESDEANLAFVFDHDELDASD